MKKQLLTIRMLLVIAMLCLGVNVSWATDYYSTSTTDGVTTTTFDFANYAKATLNHRETAAFDLTGNSVETVDKKTLYVIQDITGNHNIYAFNYLATTSTAVIRNGNNSWNSYTNNGVWHGNGSNKRTEYFSIVNLHAGDKITFYGNRLYFCSRNVTTSVNKGDAITSETEYTIASGTQLDIALNDGTNNAYCYIGKIVIKSQYDALTNPSMARATYGSPTTPTTIRITAGKSNNSGATVTTYYTLDGSTPTAEHYDGSFTTATKDVEISSTKTIKAVSVTSGTYGGSSYVVSGEFEHEYQPLAAPTATVTAFTKSGDVYYPTFTFSSDQSGTPGYTDETLTYTYSFNSASPVTASSYAATATGTLRVTVSAEGFQSSYTDIDVVSYTSTYYFDGGMIYDHAATTTAGDYQVNKAGCTHYTMTGMYINGLTVSGLSHAWGITNDVSVGLYGRTGSGSVSYTGSFPTGSYIYYFNVAKESGEWLVSSSSTVNFAQYYGMTALRVLVPTGSAEAYSLASGTDLTQNGAFTSNVSGWNTVGTITKESDSSTSGNGFGWNSNGWAEMWADNNSESADYAHYNSDCYIAQRYVNVPAGKYFVSADLVANGGNVSVYTISVNGVVQDTDNGYFDNWTTKAHVINVPSDNSTITIKYAPQIGGRAWVGIDNVSCIFDCKVTVTIASSGYSSLGSKYGLDFANATTSTEGATALIAYAATKSSDTSVKLVSINEAPAETGVIVKGTPGATYTIPVKADAAALTVTNLLHAAVTDTPIEANTSYIMQGGQFHLVTEASTVPAGKAYLVPSIEHARELTFVFDGQETTGINVATNKKTTTGVYYNLAGQRVNQPVKGIYVVDGKKVIK